MDIKKVTVIGANGTMGSNISGIFASFGNAKVYMVSRDIDKSKNAMEKAVTSVKADAVKQNLIPADYNMLTKCVKESDLVFECVTEDLNTKMNIAKIVAENLREDAIACTGTSGLSVSVIAESFPESLRSNFLGVHMFNPPYSLTFCEVIATKYTNRAIVEEIKKYLSNVLFRSVIEVKDSPAFIGNRIGFQFINQALQYAEKYKAYGGIDYIDAIFGLFTGRSMEPLKTSDFVGLDIHKAIVNNIYENTNDYAHSTFVLPTFVIKLIEDNKLGRKSNAGLYKRKLNEFGSKKVKVYDIYTGEYRDETKYNLTFAEKMIYYLQIGDYKLAFKSLFESNSQEANICIELLLNYIIYALVIEEEVGIDCYSSDIAMATGFNWCPPRAMIKAISNVQNINLIIKERIDSALINSIDIEKLLSNVDTSIFDYRPFFKAIG